MVGVGYAGLGALFNTFVPHIGIKLAKSGNYDFIKSKFEVNNIEKHIFLGEQTIILLK